VVAKAQFLAFPTTAYLHHQALQGVKAEQPTLPAEHLVVAVAPAAQVKLIKLVEVAVAAILIVPQFRQPQVEQEMVHRVLRRWAAPPDFLVAAPEALLITELEHQQPAQMVL
jgi:hypothetical protein